MLVESPTRYVIPPAYARGLPTAPARAPLRASSAAASRPLRARAASSLHALHYASGVRGYAAHLDYPRAPQKSRHAASDYALAACHAFCGDGARPKSSLALETVNGVTSQ